MLSQLYINFMQAAPSKDQVDSGFGFVIAAYAVVWLLIFGYIYSLNRRQTKLRREVDALKQEEAERKQQQAIISGGSSVETNPTSQL
jgi:CcmD family protein